MPWHYTVDTARGVTLIVATGTASGEELIALQQQLHADPLFDPLMRQICDLRDAELAGVSSDVIKLVADRARNGMVRGRRAIVAQPGLAFGLSRMFSAYADPEDLTTEVFTSLSAAEQWLGLDA